MDLIQVKFDLKRSSSCKKKSDTRKHSWKEKNKPKPRLLQEKRVISSETGQSFTGHDQECKHAKQEEADGNVLTNTHIQTLTEDLIFREVRLFRKKLSEMKMVVSEGQIHRVDVSGSDIFYSIVKLG